MLLVVLPFYSGDSSMLSSNLLWMRDLDGKLPYECLLATDDQTPVKNSFATQLFSKVHTFQYPRVQEESWPFPQNNAFMHVAWYVASKFKCPFLWVETDSVPVRKGWLDDIAAEYKRGGKPFGGHLNKDGIFNGVAVYPHNIVDYSTKALTAALVNSSGRQPPWDVYASPQIIKHCHNMNGLFQHVWDIDGKAPTFPDQASLGKIRPGVAIFHRNKDGTLIKQLRKSLRIKTPKINPEWEKAGSESDVHFITPEPIRFRFDGQKLVESKPPPLSTPNPNWKSP